MDPRYPYLPHAAFSPEPDTEVEVLEDVEVDLLEALGYGSNLVIYNDDVNTFDWVIQCLMEVLDHTSEQAEQNAMLIHFKGKAGVKSGSHDTLQPYKDALTERGLSAVIESEVA